jgi:hypothetical protein
MLQIRTRLVNFRVTEEEFERLKSACNEHGARCLSDYARALMLGTPHAGSESIAAKVVALDRRLAVLELSLSALHYSSAKSNVDLAQSES